MGATKFELFESDICELTALFKSIAHPARLKMMLLIAESLEGQISTEDIASQIDLSQSTISYHLKHLKDVGIVESKIVSLRKVSIQVYRIQHKALKKVIDSLEIMLNKMESKSDPNFVSLSKFYSKFRDFHFGSSILQV